MQPDIVAAYQQTGIIVMLAPMLAMLILLAFAVMRLAIEAHAVRSVRKLRKPINRYQQQREQSARIYTAQRASYSHSASCNCRRCYDKRHA